MTEPTTLASDGFISDEVPAVIDTIRQRYPGHFRHLRTLNALLTAAQYRLNAHQESAQELICAVLFVRSLAHCQAVLVLVERGMSPSARAMARCALEGLFNLGACAADAGMALSFLDADQVDRRRRAKYLGQVSDAKARSTLDQADLGKILRELEAKIEEVEAREFRTREMARAAGFEDLYLTAYSHLSGAVHSSVGDLDQHFRVNPGGNGLEMLTEPTVEQLEGVFLVLAETMVGLARAASKVFTLDILEQCELELVEFQRLYNATG